MRSLRTAFRRRLTVILSALAALALSAGLAQGALSGSGPVPSPTGLANAILGAFRAPEPDGIAAKIHFTNDLLPSGSLPGGMSSPLASGADGRIWIQKSGDFRLELQSDAGDAQIVSRGDKLTVFDASTNTVYKLTLPADANEAAKPAGGHDEQLTLAKIQRALDRLARTWTISGARPTSTAGHPTYSVRISPKDDGGLLGAVELAWDAVRGAPLRAAVYAQDKPDPVLELKATDVSYDAVSDADVHVDPPAGAHVVDLRADDLAGPKQARKAGHGAHARNAHVQGPAAVRRELDFELAAPGKLAGLPRREVRLVSVDGHKAALVTYGKGFGAIAVLEHKAKPAGDQKGSHDGSALRLPEINIDGATGSELATALGTVVQFERGGVGYLVAGSVPPVAAENAARGLK